MDVTDLSRVLSSLEKLEVVTGTDIANLFGLQTGLEIEGFVLDDSVLSQDEYRRIVYVFLLAAFPLAVGEKTDGYELIDEGDEGFNLYVVNDDSAMDHPEIFRYTAVSSNLDSLATWYERLEEHVKVFRTHERTIYSAEVSQLRVQKGSPARNFILVMSKADYLDSGLDESRPSFVTFHYADLFWGERVNGLLCQDEAVTSVDAREAVRKLFEELVSEDYPVVVIGDRGEPFGSAPLRTGVNLVEMRDRTRTSELVLLSMFVPVFIQWRCKIAPAMRAVNRFRGQIFVDLEIDEELTPGTHGALTEPVVYHRPGDPHLAIIVPVAGGKSKLVQLTERVTTKPVIEADTLYGDMAVEIPLRFSSEERLQLVAATQRERLRDRWAEFTTDSSSEHYVGSNPTVLFMHDEDEALSLDATLVVLTVSAGGQAHGVSRGTYSNGLVRSYTNQTHRLYRRTIEFRRIVELLTWLGDSIVPAPENSH
jgi:hypothetical protein